MLIETKIIDLIVSRSLVVSGNLYVTQSMYISSITSSALTSSKLMITSGANAGYIFMSDISTSPGEAPGGTPAAAGGTPALPSQVSGPSGIVDSAAQVSGPGLPKPAAKAPRQGWWKVKGIKGAKANVARAVQNMAVIPPHWQAALQAELAAHDAPAVCIHAHYIRRDASTSSAQATSPAGATMGGTPVAPPAAKGRILLCLDISPIEGWQGPD